LHNLAQGMIELKPPQKLLEITANMVLNADSIHQYRNRCGEEVYRNAIVRMLQKRFDVNHIATNNILAICGVSAGMVSTLTTLRNEAHQQGKQFKVGLLVPFYTYHMRQIMEVTGSEPVYVETNPDFSPNFLKIEDVLSRQHLNVIIFTNPGNPQGNLWPRDDVRKMVALTKQYNCNLLIDEIYCDLVWRGQFFSPIQDPLQDHVVVCRGFAKTLGCQSWRVGFLIAAPQTVDRIMRTHDPLYISVPWMQHCIAEYLDNHYDDYLNHIKIMSELMQGNLQILGPAFQKTFGWEPIQPDGSMYMMFKHHSTSDKEAVALGLRKGVGVAPGKIFFAGMPNQTEYVRIHVGIAREKAIAIANTLSS